MELLSKSEDQNNLQGSSSSSSSSQTLVELLHLLDEAWVQLDPSPRPKQDQRQKINQLKANSPLFLSTQDFGNIPPKIPRNWVTEEVMQTLSRAEQISLDFQDEAVLAPIHQYLKDFTAKP
ncbi:hypothetical protein O181_000972 [Austropuccinia psidii MF-1]|uniref:Uncharacterized protein n=1 Tax=Austropuccinia psidii MF-1 TaxID=1389203 RepID=A0A9Q3B9P1_9BASI|nr:hypothetical protein [Austropuccinia psidii MF-1]